MICIFLPFKTPRVAKPLGLNKTIARFFLVQMFIYHVVGFSLQSLCYNFCLLEHKSESYPF